ncbi:hypothetical protein CIK05_08380 [Bdellovibrio sp. qaytius]|nr:hypothetical protein CIK05_08380 [Bdellovibrio sp. qaytius]
MKIKLHEIPEDGRDYIFNRKTGELNTVLEDLIEKAEYTAQLYIRPLNTKNYDVKGSIKSETQELCSHCGENFNFKAQASFHEILIPGAEEIKNSQFSKSNHVSELNQDGPGVSEYFADQFDVGEFLHEALAFSIPFNPRHDKGDPACKTSFKSEAADLFVYDEKMGNAEEQEKKNNAFNVLKGLKLN